MLFEFSSIWILHTSPSIIVPYKERTLLRPLQYSSLTPFEFFFFFFLKKRGRRNTLSVQKMSETPTVPDSHSTGENALQEVADEALLWARNSLKEIGDMSIETNELYRAITEDLVRVRDLLAKDYNSKFLIVVFIVGWYTNVVHNRCSSNRV